MKLHVKVLIGRYNILVIFITVVMSFSVCKGTQILLKFEVLTVLNINTFAPRGELVLHGISCQQSGRSTSTPRF